MAQRKKQIIRKRQKPGASPGTLAAPEGAQAPIITLMAYDKDGLIEKTVKAPEEITPCLKPDGIVWVNVDGLGSVTFLEDIGRLFNLHTLALEDVLTTHQRPKTEDYGDHLFIVTRMASIRDGVLDMEQFSLFVGKNFVLSFQEKPGDCLDAVRQRIRGGRRIRMMHSDYLAYAIVDAVIDGYFPVLENYGEKLYGLEDEVVEKPRHELIARIHDAKRDLRALRHSLWPMREMLNGFSADTDVVHEETRPYLRDAHDHIIQVLDMLETYREVASSLVDIYLSSVSNRMNEIMKVLTIIATIFMPLSFIASLYGMNFHTDVSPWNMPELNWRFGYFYALGLMAAVTGGLMVYFRRRGWI